MHDIILSSIIDELSRDQEYARLGIPIVNYPHEGLDLPYLYMWINQLDENRDEGVPSEEQYTKVYLTCSLKSLKHGQSQGLSVLSHIQNKLCGRGFRIFKNNHGSETMCLRLLDHQIDPKKQYCLEMQLEAILAPSSTVQGESSNEI